MRRFFVVLTVAALGCAPAPAQTTSQEVHACRDAMPVQDSDMPWVRNPPQGFFTSPELGSPSHINHRDRLVYPACERTKAIEHAFWAQDFGRVLERTGEPDLRGQRTGRVVRVISAFALSHERAVYRLELNASVSRFHLATISSVGRHDRPAPVTIEELEAHVLETTVVRTQDVPITAAQAGEIWRLQRAVQPDPEGYIGSNDGYWLLIESMDEGRRDARVVLLTERGAARALLRKLHELEATNP